MARKTRKKKHEEVAAADEAAVSSIPIVPPSPPVRLPMDVSAASSRLYRTVGFVGADRIEVAPDPTPITMLHVVGDNLRRSMVELQEVSSRIGNSFAALSRANERGAIFEKVGMAAWREGLGNGGLPIVGDMVLTDGPKGVYMHYIPPFFGNTLIPPSSAERAYHLVRSWIAPDALEDNYRGEYLMANEQVVRVNFTELGRQILRSATLDARPITFKGQPAAVPDNLSSFLEFEASASRTSRETLKPVRITNPATMPDAPAATYKWVADRLVAKYQSFMYSSIAPSDRNQASEEVVAAFEWLLNICELPRRQYVSCIDPVDVQRRAKSPANNDMSAVMAVASNMSRAMIYSASTLQAFDWMAERWIPRLNNGGARRQISEAVMSQISLNKGVATGVTNAEHNISDYDSMATFYSLEGIIRAEIELEWSAAEPFGFRWMMHKLLRYIIQRVSCFSLGDQVINFCLRPAVFQTMADAPDLRRADNRRRSLKDRLHSTKGPAVEWVGGLAIYAYKGIVVPPVAILNPEKLTAREALAQSNAELRRVMLEIIGPERMMAELDPKKLHEDETGVLWEITTAGGLSTWNRETMRIVEVTNRTVNPDGTYSHYFLMVPPEIATARAGVAWTFRLRAEQYKPIAET